MARSSSDNRRAARWSGWIAALLTVTAGIVVTVGPAQADTSTKVYEATVIAAQGSPGSFALTLTNDLASQQTLGSANFTEPTGFTLGPVGSVSLSGWTVCVGDGQNCTPGGNVVMFRANSSSAALSPGRAVSATVPVSSPSTCASATWATAAKQSNDFSGNGNDFQRNDAASDLTPLGSFSFAPIGMQTTGVAFTASVTALDTCHNLKQNPYYAGTAPYGPTTLTPTGLTAATFDPSSGVTWSGSVGTVTVTPTIAQTGNRLTVTDGATGISAPSNSFDVVDHICQPGDASCKTPNGNSTIFVDPQPPAGGKVGVGFNNLPSFLTNFSCGGLSSPVGSALIVVDPSAAAYSGPYTVTMTYKKSVTGTGPASSFVVCISDTGAAGTWQGPLGTCVDPTAGPTPCIVTEKRTSLGDLQIVVLLSPGDPWFGT